MLKAAIIGCGFMGSTHTEALRRLGIPIAGLCGIDPEEEPERCPASESRHGLPRF